MVLLGLLLGKGPPKSMSPATAAVDPFGLSALEGATERSLANREQASATLPKTAAADLARVRRSTPTWAAVD